jgi:hypothetical protein
MVISKRFSSVFMLILAFSLAVPLEAMAAQQSHGQVKKNQKQDTAPKKSLRGQIQQFIQKHKIVFTVLGVAGALAFLLYLAPQRTRLLNEDPWNVERVLAPVGASQCPVHQIVLQPGVQQGNWTPHLVDGNNGNYAWRNLRNNRREFVPHGRKLNLNQARPERNQIAVRFQLNEPIRVRQLHVVPQAGDTCAYHALKNCQLILDELENPQGNLDVRLTDPALVQDRIGRWRDHILEHPARPCSVQDGQWLHPEGLRELVNLEHENNRITVVDAGRFQEQLVRDPLALPQPLDLNANPNHDFVHGFLVQDRAHWLTAVVRRVQGQIEWLIVDSNNQLAFNRAGLMHLLARIHGRIA